MFAYMLRMEHRKWTRLSFHLLRNMFYLHTAYPMSSYCFILLPSGIFLCSLTAAITTVLGTGVHSYPKDDAKSKTEERRTQTYDLSSTLGNTYFRSLETWTAVPSGTFAHHIKFLWLAWCLCFDRDVLSHAMSFFPISSLSSPQITPRFGFFNISKPPLRLITIWSPSQLDTDRFYVEAWSMKHCMMSGIFG